MKKIVIALGLLMPFFSSAQQQEGKIVFQEKVKMDFESRMDDEMMQQPGMAEMMKKLQEQASRSKKVLVFKGPETLYRNFDAEQDAEASWTSGDGNMEMQVMVMRPSSTVYRNSESKKLVEKHDFMGKEFLIEENEEPLKWKITGESEVIAGYQCQKATTKRDTNDIIVWFTPQIPVSAGPQRLGGLPGMILKADIDNGRLTIEAQKAEFKEVGDDISIPTKGKRSPEWSLMKFVKPNSKK